MTSFANKTIKETINEDGYIIHNVKGISMLPLFVENEDLVQIGKINEPLKPLDVILYSRKDNHNKLVLHRILKTKKHYYLVCGDNQNTYEKVYPKQIIGKLKGYYKKGRYVSTQDQEYIDYINNLELDLNKRMHVTLIKQSIKDFVSLLRTTITNYTFDQSNVNYKSVYSLAKDHKLSAFIFNSIDSNYCDNETYDKFKQDYNTCIQRTILFDNERSKIYKQLNKNKIKYVPLKGIIINTLYPTYGTRFFTDNDILFDTTNDVKQIMIDLGYHLKHDTRIELAFYKNPIFNFELHQTLFNDKLPYSKYFNNILNSAIQYKDYEYHLSNEDFYAYFIAHFNKHYEGSGAGIKFYVDLYYMVNKLQVDKTKLDNLLKELGLYDFNQKVTNTMNELFVNGNYPIMDLNIIFKGSAFGSKDYRIEKQIREQGKLKYFMKRVFPSVEDLSWSRPYLKKYPLLLPGIWIYRIFKPKNISVILNEIKHLLSK